MRARLKALHADDRGFTLMDTLVGMSVMGLFMGIFTGAMIMMGNTMNKVEALAATSQQVNNAFLALDRSVRYGSAISAAAQSGAKNDWNVEFATTTTGQTVCTQLRVDNKTLQSRTWTVGSNGTSYSGLTGWAALASNVTNGTATAGVDQPFKTFSYQNSSFQSLTITIASSSSTTTTATSRASLTFTALNSTAASSATTPCQQVAVDATQ